MAVNRKRIYTIVMLLTGILFMVLFQVRTFAADDYVIEDGVLTRYNGSEKNVVIPDGVKEIGARAFNGCYEGVETVVIPKGVTKIDESAFLNCQSLKTVTLPDGLVKIGEKAFFSCEKLESVVIPNSVKKVGRQAFAYCTSLKSARLSKNLTKLEESTFFNCTSLTKVIINSGVTIIDRTCFYNCNKLLYVDFPSTLTTIGIAAFSGCSSLVQISLPKTLEIISWNAFYGCSSLTDVYFEGNQSQWNEITIREDTNELNMFEPNGNIIVENAKKTFNKKTVYFNDVLSSNAYANYITFLYDRGAMTGKNDANFDMNSTLRRDETVTMLWRNEGSQITDDSQITFKDIVKGGWYYNAVVWANNMNIVTGKRADEFDRGQITRQEFILIMYRFATYKGYDISVVDKKSYMIKEDAGTVNSWAAEAMNWGFEKGLIGVGSPLRPREPIMRKDAAAIFARFIQKFDK